MTHGNKSIIQITRRDVVATIGGVNLVRYVFGRSGFRGNPEDIVTTRAIPAHTELAPSSDRTWIEIKHAADEFGIAFEHLYTLVDENVIAGQVQGRRMFVGREDLAAYVNAVLTEYFTIKQASARTGLSQSTLRRIASQDRDAIKIGRRWYMHPELVAELERK